MAVEVAKQTYRPGRGARHDVIVDGQTVGFVEFLPPIKFVPECGWQACVNGEWLKPVATKEAAVSQVLAQVGMVAA